MNHIKTIGKRIFAWVPAHPKSSGLRGGWRAGVLGKLLVAFLALTGFTTLSAQAAENYAFGVLSQRSAVLTAEYWNPILDYVSRQSGVKLTLKIARSGPESTDAIARGDYDFVYSNHLFKGDTLKQGYQVILKPLGEPLRAQIVTTEDSRMYGVINLQGQEVGFASKAAFVGYVVPMDHLLRSKLTVKPVFGGTQEGVMAQLKAGRIPAAGVNNLIMRSYAAREGFKYRVLWESDAYQNLPIAAHPRVPQPAIEAVRKAFSKMPNEPEGMKVLADSAAILKQKGPFGFTESSPREYQNYIDFYRNTLVQDIE
jgi:phosphonate transport system substrate-binding protein